MIPGVLYVLENASSSRKIDDSEDDWQTAAPITQNYLSRDVGGGRNPYKAIHEYLVTDKACGRWSIRSSQVVAKAMESRKKGRETREEWDVWC